ncbi:DNA polymerase I [Brachyspira hyodysenteriae]|uniref:DNA polymerase I n=1 Tax=Brachyspira hyodysenteriae (strain ATCC 49526 / WA1) TaxID=565034 RepID=A0A3B6VC68_BRAHW|nr:DNA polymerase I [Brachyspira hyodysenteriae]ACN85040.1 DNA polymerase I [Brachyspira hyodysenteriae WA1]KLI39729.1 DNA polymerase I [Brachyspira hyodysenteriae]KLI44383.1 DNA polymerase I [Brachyspira hyodysenteriae]KLI52747.1 DNA polymerase I [Brachyspira hyodysenteriae]KLI58019.1 DNA polymerase I [Brachyspira hyodysenteriae]
MKKTFLIIDAFGILYRYHFIFLKRPLLNSKGQNVSSINGFMRTYFSLINTYPAEYVAIALDSSRKTFRNEIYKEYKENRESMPDDLRSQIPILYNLIDALGISRIVLDNYEADDIVGTIAERNKKENIKTIIYSPDKDILQLVDDDVKVVASNKDNELMEYDAQAVKEKRGVYPNQIIDLLSLMGDASDNIPGVKGVGEKTALKLLEEYKSLDGIYENIDSIKGKIQEKLLESKDMAYMSYKLATIERNIEGFNLDYNEIASSKINIDEVNKILDELELKQIRDKINSYIYGSSKKEDKVKISNDKINKDNDSKTEEAPILSAKDNKSSYYLIENETELENLLKDINSKKLVCIDFETTGLDTFKDTIIGISFAIKSNEAFYLDLSGRTKIDKDKCMNLVFDTLEKEDIKVIGHNLKYEYKMMRAIGKSIGNMYFDTMVAAYLINPTRGRYNMDDLAIAYLSYNTIKYADLTDNAKKTLLDAPLKDVVEYACEDADVTFRFYECFAPLLKTHNLEDLFFNIEMPLVSVLADMEFDGVYISSERMKALSDEYSSLLEKTKEKIYKEAGEEFNLQSPKQLEYILFDKMGIPPTKKTKTGFSTDEEVLTELSQKYKIAEYMLTYRKYAKLKNTYLDVFPTLINEKTGRIHASFNQTVTATGRLSSSEPNLQNIPVRGEEGREIRNTFIPEKGNLLIAADYSQIELRLLAHFSNDPTLVEAFKNNDDIHRKTAMKIYSVSKEHVTASMRNIAKIINFSIIYGKTAFGLSKELGIKRKEAEDFIKGYFSTYSRVKPFCEEVVEEVRNKGFVRTMCGRIRDLSKTINSSNAMARNEAERMALNTLIQGSAADMIKVAMVAIHKEFKNHLKTAKIVMQVHDELVVEVSEAEADKAMTIMKEIMEHSVKANVPIIVDIHKGNSWGEVH